MISKDDIKDLDIVDALELAATGVSFYRTGTTVVSTTSGTKLVTISGSFSVVYGDDPIESGDFVVLAGTSAADGIYTVDSILTDQTFTVVESINTSTGGNAGFKHKAGAYRVGIDTSSFDNTTSTTVQEVLADVDVKLSDLGYRRHFLLMGG